MHPAAGGLLHHRLQRFALAEGIEDRSDGTDLQRIGTEEHQVVQHPVHFGQRRAQPHRTLRDFDAHQAFDRERDAEFVGERGQPVMPVRQHDDLAIVADLEQLLGAPVHVADDRLG